MVFFYEIGLKIGFFLDLDIAAKWRIETPDINIIYLLYTIWQLNYAPANGWLSLKDLKYRVKWDWLPEGSINV